MKVAVFGGDGWIGKQFVELLERSGDAVTVPCSRVECAETGSLREYLRNLQPTHVVSLIGRTHGRGCNTIDYLQGDDKLHQNVGDNLFGPVSLAMLCRDLGIHFTYFGTGCIFDAGTQFKLFRESDPPNFFGSNYSVVKGYTDSIMKLTNSLNVRIRMPITENDHPRNFISKIIRYSRVCSISNSMTVLPTLLPVVIQMMRDLLTGTVNLTNPGVISHNEILEMYKKHVDPYFRYTNFTLDEQNAVLKSRRSNNALDTTVLQSVSTVPPIREAVEWCLRNWNAKLAGHDTVLVTGGCGAIGAEMLNYYKKVYRGTTFVNLDLLTYCGKPDHIERAHPESSDNYVFVHGDITDMSLVYDTMYNYNPTMMIHLAAETHVDSSYTNGSQFTKTNVLGTHVLLEAARMYGKFRSIVHVSTDEVYGPVDDASETAVYSPSNPYAASKAGAELLCHAYTRSYGLPITIVRCNNAMSRYQDPEKLIPKAISCVMKGERIPVHGDGSSRRTWIHAVDIARAIVCILERADGESIKNVFNIGSNDEFTVLQVIARIVQKLAPGKSVDDFVYFTADRPFQDRRYNMNLEKLEALGYMSSMSFEASLDEIIQYNITAASD